MIFVFLAVHLYFLYFVWTRISMMSVLLCVVFPIFELYLYYRDWHQLRGFFFVKLALIVAIYIVAS
jgi:hypothetical protein